MRFFKYFPADKLALNRFNPPIRFILTIAALWLACISAIAGSKGNPGSSAFRGAHFKPTVIINHDAVKTASGTATLTTYAAYDALYRPLRTESEYEPGQFATTEVIYGAITNGKEARIKESIDDRGKVVRTFADGLGRTLAVTDGFGTALAATTTTEYSSTGFAWKTIDPLGRESESDFDAAGRVVAQWSPDPTTTTGLVNRTAPTDQVSGSPVVRTAYDKNSNVTVTVNPLGARHEFTYDARNRKVEERQPEVVSTEIINGSPVSSILAQPLIETAFDDVGNVIAVTDARGNTTRTFHDKAYRVTHMVSNPVTGNPSSDLQNLGANDIVVQSIFDPNGNVVEAIDANGNATRNQYDSLNRLVATASNPSDGQPNAPPAAPKSDDIVVLSERDDAGNLVKVTDGEGRITEFRQDGMGRKTRTIWDAGSAVEHVEEFAFDGLVQTSRTDPMERVTSYQYDARHRLTDILYTGASADDRHFSYDLLGNQLSVTYPNETPNMQTIRGTAQSFDKLDRVVTETSTGVTHSYGYDRANNRVSTVYGGTGRTLHSSYDRQNRLLICTESGDQSTYYFYDHNSNVTRKVLPSGAEKRAVFDALNRRLIDSDLAPNGSVVSSFDYSQPQNGYPSGYDHVGNLMLSVESYGHASVKNRTVTNSYDQAYRLATETIAETGGSSTVTAYQYDKGNNRTQKSITVEGGAAVVTNSVYGTTTDGYNSNQLKSASDGTTTTEFSYDLNGNRSEKKVNGVTAQTYSWDHENRLTQLTEAGTGTYHYAYDHRTRRVLRDESQAGGQSTVLTFSGGLSVQEYLSGGSTPTVEYIRGSDYGGGVGGVLYTIRNGNRSFNAYNSRGDVVSQTDDSGAITWQSSYEAFGTRTQEQGTTQDRQKANTKDEDPTGLLNEHYRYRDLEFGVFISQDPAGFVDGPNVYSYVRQNPWTFFDPHGLSMFGIETNVENKTDTFTVLGASFTLGGKNTNYRAGWLNGQAEKKPVRASKPMTMKQFKSDVSSGVSSLPSEAKKFVQYPFKHTGRLANELLDYPGNGLMSGTSAVVPKLLEKTPEVTNSARATYGSAKQMVFNLARNKASRATVDDKLQRYLLNMDHAVGGAKAKWFDQALGFTQNNADQLAKQLVFNPKLAQATELTQHGQKYNQVISVVGANKKKIDVSTAWIKKKGDGFASLVTAIPTSKKK